MELLNPVVYTATSNEFSMHGIELFINLLLLNDYI